MQVKGSFQAKINGLSLKRESDLHDMGKDNTEDHAPAIDILVKNFNWGNHTPPWIINENENVM